jgi:hypothetical protein
MGHGFRFRVKHWMGLAAFACLACMASTVELKQALDVTAKEDLKIILEDIPPPARPSLLPDPHYVIDEYEEFRGDTALVYQARAKLVFFYLNSSLNLCQIRKYRFKRSANAWERYEVELKHTPQKYLDTLETRVQVP